MLMCLEEKVQEDFFPHDKGLVFLRPRLCVAPRLLGRRVGNFS